MPKRVPQKAEPPQACVRLKRLRTALGLKQREMAARLGVKRQDHYKQFEVRTRPTREIVVAIEKEFGLPPAAFLSDETIPSADFNHMIENLRDGTVRKGTNLISHSQMAGHTVSRGADATPRTEGVVVGPGSIEFILTTLAEMKADIATNKKLIADLQEGRKAKKGF